MTDSRVTVVPVVTPAAPVRPEEYDTATRAALEHIDGQAVRAVADGRPERTRKGYAQDWASWSKFCGATGGLVADMRVSKIRPRIVPVPYGSRPSICPVRAWTAWKEAAELTDPDDYAWRRLHSRWHTLMEGGLQPESIGDVITRAGERAGIEIRFTGHSPRRGLATSSRLKGHDQIVIAKQGGLAPHSKVLAGYLEVVDQWEDNALIGVL
ncbi:MULTISPECIES: hypothetical protein [Streptomyces]|uniref:Integrase n=1 Tax=Streptomyces dengpaensis TaxID=2049881 RepID=A0ABN5HUM8_9ACTN|nr:MULTISPECIES: hypothetical protein [Streptomyces]AVH54629.1 hypothetical protein C4B68_00930 [Streptomyces dengpaensis]PIA96441.1 hypothetical protein B1C81_39935 [Streptomyces sp. HG99]